ncbi:ferric-chelate reductase 1-like [Cloeon dipterum]|uniref:ferric-chelate reductase 1-like n=1 Tax=Cloeon dipterum TaxID=197152 RepID=UPI00322091A9
MLKIVVLCAFLAIGALAFPGGAPTTACDSMTPLHNGSPQPNPESPYTVTATAIDTQRYEVAINSADGTPFKGFLIQARSTLNDEAVGSFDVADNSKNIDCFTTVGSASTHIDNSNKTSVSVIWNAPASGEDVQFVASVVQSTLIFWVKLPATVA